MHAGSIDTPTSKSKENIDSIGLKLKKNSDKNKNKMITCP